MTGKIEPVHIRFLSAAAFRRITPKYILDVRLLPTEYHMQRWAESQGTDFAIDPEAADVIPKLKLPPLPDDEAVITDQIVLDAPEYWRTFIHSWYRSPKPAEVIAAELGVKKRQIFWERKLVLAYLLGRLTQAGIKLASYRFK